MPQPIMLVQPMIWTTELSIYVAKEARGQGIGSALYTALEEELQARGYLRFLACIAVPNEASISMHESGAMFKWLISQRLAISLTNGMISSGCKRP